MRTASLLFLLALSVANGQTPANNESASPSWYIADTGTQVVNFNDTNDYLPIEGMWYSTSTAKSKQLIAPIAVSISCNRHVKICREIDATIAMGILRPDTTDYTVFSWTNEQIVAENANDGPCKITHRLVVDFISKTVTLTDLPSQVDTKECRMYRDANSYILHGGQVMLSPGATYDPLKLSKEK